MAIIAFTLFGCVVANAAKHRRIPTCRELWREPVCALPVNSRFNIAAAHCNGRGIVGDEKENAIG